MMPPNMPLPPVPPAGAPLPPMLPPDPPQPVMLHDVKVVTKRTVKQAKVEGVPPEEFGISRLAKSIRDATYAFHTRPTRTETELIEDGYDADQIKGLASTAPGQSLESLARDTVQEQSQGGFADTEGNRPVTTTEHYIKLDYEERGVAKIYKVVTGGVTLDVLERDGKPDIECVDFMPFAAMTPFIVTHRFYGRSVADMVMDIQRIKTSLLRGALDNIYLANNQRMEISEAHASKNTIDDLLTNRPGGIVRTKQPGGLTPIPNTPLGQFVFPMIQYMDGTREWRSGVSQQSMGLTGDALQNQTATQANNQFGAAQARIKLIARIFAETGIRDLFSLLHAVIRKNDRERNTVRLRNKWVQVDPRDWKTRNDMTINVGIGSGTRPEQQAAIGAVLNAQKQAMEAPQLGLVKPVNIYNALKKLVQLSGLKTVDLYFTDPTEPQLDPDGNPLPTPQPAPDPKMAQIQAQMELEKAKAQADIAMTQADMAMNQQKIAAEIDLAQKKAQFDQQLATMQFQMDAQRQEREAQLAANAQLLDHQLKTQDQVNKAQANQATMPGMPLRPPSEMINFKDVTDPVARAQMLQQAGVNVPAPQPPAAPPLDTPPQAPQA